MIERYPSFMTHITRMEITNMVNNALMMWCRPNQGARQRDVAPKRPNSVNNDSQPSLQSAF